MEIHLAPDTEARLQHLATSQGKDPAQLVEETVTRMVQHDIEFLEGVERGITAADRADFVESNEVWANVEKILQS
jgi:predicted transcriptional regulator